MASGPFCGGGDDSREKQRWGESKVYTRKIHNKNPKILPSQTLAEDGNSSQLVIRFDAASDDSSSLNRKQVSINRETPAGNGISRPISGGFPRLENRVTINLSSKSKQEMRELRRKLTNELDQVRTLSKKLEARELQITGYSGVNNSGYSHSQMSANDGIDNSGKKANSEVASGGAITPRMVQQDSRPLNPLSISMMENSQGGSDIVEKEKRTPKANQYYRNSDFVLGKDKFPPPESSKKAKINGNKKEAGTRQLGEFLGDKMPSQVFKECSSLLTKLMKHKHGWVFNAPVDVKALGLHDYNSIIKHPMDLGTVKSKLNKNWYKSGGEFGEDVRLTFRNAMTYNPVGHDVHIMAEQLLKMFEDRWKVIEANYLIDRPSSRFAFDQQGSLAHIAKNAPSPDLRKVLDRSESTTMVPVDPKPKPLNVPSVRTAAPKKPKAKDPHKRDMTYEEKQKLSTNLQSLPPEKLDNIVQIIKKRNSALCQNDDEIEVDIDSVDTETLWELDRFVTNYKKSLSKNKRKAELASQAKFVNMHNAQENIPASTTVEVPKDSKTGKSLVSPSSPVGKEKHGDAASRSSSSSSSSSDSGSSSSDSDSESSST